ncbi:extracellular solute-binding protein [Paenibacillus periandrae]|uniref:extracellular solute-binding protein n=1 Tax=Paenibacillus periandrae TaxID=1761741 RepID=UPI001F08F11E|nr:extracellular solute-binding protein [Paenibacillus periandrae]
MINKSWKSIVWATTTIIAVGSLSACSGGAQGTGTSSSGQQQTKPGETPTVTILMSKGTNFPEANPVIDQIRKKTGANVQVIAVDLGDYENKLNAMIASGSPPDIFNSYSKPKIKDLVDNKAILELDSLLEKSGKNISENKGKYLKGIGYIDGKTYAIPNAYGLGNGLAIRQDWLDKLGLKVPTTLDEYENVLKAFVTKDPDGNGKNDTIGLGLSVSIDQTFEHVFAAYGVPLKRGVLVDGKVTPWALAPGYLDAVKYYNKLYKEGLLEPDFATVPAMQEYEKLWNGKMGAFQFNPPGTTQNWMTRYIENPKPKFVYTTLKGPNGQGGNVRFVREDKGPWTHISSKSKNPEAAMKVLDFLISEEGDRLTWAGIEGTTYTMKDGKFEWIKPYDDAVQLRNQGGFAYSAIIQRLDGMEFQLMNDTTRKGIELSYNSPIPDAYLFGVPDIERDKKKVLDDMELEFRTSAIVSKGDLDKLYADFKKKYLAEGGSTWIEQATVIYNKEKAELKK